MRIEELENKIKKCRNMSLDEISLEDVDEISSIKIDKRKSSNERILEFLKECKNPYIFKVNNNLVKISFSDTSKTADDCLTNVLSNLYK